MANDAVYLITIGVVTAVASAIVVDYLNKNNAPSGNNQTPSENSVFAYSTDPVYSNGSQYINGPQDTDPTTQAPGSVTWVQNPQAPRSQPFDPYSDPNTLYNSGTLDTSQVVHNNKLQTSVASYSARSYSGTQSIGSQQPLTPGYIPGNV